MATHKTAHTATSNNQAHKHQRANGTAPVASALSSPDKNSLHPLGEKIFLDRYALKDGKKESVAVGDTVIVAVNLETGQREIGAVTALNGQNVTIQLRDGDVVERALEYIDKPLETQPAQMLDRVAQGMAAVELPEKQPEWQQKFRWLLDEWKFVPGGRILTAAEDARSARNLLKDVSPRE